MLKRLAILAGLALLPLCADGQQISGGRPALVPLFAYGSSTGIGNGADTTEDTLQTYVLPARTLAKAGDRLRIVAGGSYVGSTDVRAARVKFGGTQISIAQSNNATSVAWRHEVEVQFISAGVQQTSAGVWSSVVVAAIGVVSNTAVGIDETSPITILVTGQNSTNATPNTIVLRYLTIDLISGP